MRLNVFWRDGNTSSLRCLSHSLTMDLKHLHSPTVKTRFSLLRNKLNLTFMFSRRRQMSWAHKVTSPSSFKQIVILRIYMKNETQKSVALNQKYLTFIKHLKYNTILGIGAAFKRLWIQSIFRYTRDDHQIII